MDIEKYVKLNDEGKIEIDKDAFQSGLDAEIYKAVDKYRNGKGKDEIRKQLEEEAKLTAEQKLKAEREEFEKYKQQETVKLVREKAKAKFIGKDFTEKEIEFILSKLGNDEENDMAAIDALIEDRTKFVTETQQKAIQNIQQQQQNSGSMPFPTPDNNDTPAPTTRTKDEILSFYRAK